jgi:hypothetical protein
MNMPGFTAEESLNATSGHYRQVRIFGSTDVNIRAVLFLGGFDDLILPDVGEVTVELSDYARCYLACRSDRRIPPSECVRVCQAAT